MLRTVSSSGTVHSSGYEPTKVNIKEFSGSSDQQEDQSDDQTSTDQSDLNVEPSDLSASAQMPDEDIHLSPKPLPFAPETSFAAERQLDDIAEESTAETSVFGVDEPLAVSNTQNAQLLSAKKVGVKIESEFRQDWESELRLDYNDGTACKGMSGRDNKRRSSTRLPDHELPEASIQDFHVGKATRKFVIFRETVDLLSAGGDHRPLGKCVYDVQNLGEKDELFLIHMKIEAKSDESLLGTTLTSVVTNKLETLKEKRLEYYTLQDGFTQHRHFFYGLNDEGDYYCSTRYRGTTKHDVESTLPRTDTRTFIGEGANLLLLRMMAMFHFKGRLKTKAILTNGSMHDCEYCSRGPTIKKVNGQKVPTFRIKRVILLPFGRDVCRTLVTTEGQLVEHRWVEGEFIVRINPQEQLYLHCPPTKSEQIAPVPWEEDIQLCSEYSDCKDQSILKQKSYMAQHEQLYNAVSDFVLSTVRGKPANVIEYAIRFFSRFKHSDECIPTYDDQ